MHVGTKDLTNNVNLLNSFKKMVSKVKNSSPNAKLVFSSVHLSFVTCPSIFSLVFHSPQLPSNFNIFRFLIILEPFSRVWCKYKANKFRKSFKFKSFLKSLVAIFDLGKKLTLGSNFFRKLLSVQI